MILEQVFFIFEIVSISVCDTSLLCSVLYSAQYTDTWAKDEWQPGSPWALTEKGCTLLAAHRYFCSQQVPEC